MDNNAPLTVDELDLFISYNKVIALLPEEFQTVSGVLYSLVITTIENNVEVNTNNNANKGEDKYNIFPASVVTTPKGELLELMTTGNSAIFQSLLNSDRLKYPLRSDEAITNEMEDAFSVKTVRLSSLIPPEAYTYDGKLQMSNNIPSINGLIIFEIQATIRCQINRILSAGVFPIKPEFTAIERGIKETELLSFSSLSTSDLYRSNQMQELAELILSVTKPLPNFTGALRTSNGEDGSVLKRKYFRHISAFIVSQIISKELLKEPTIVQKYYPLTDDLLYAISWPPPDRRNKQEKWTPPISCIKLIKGEQEVNNTVEISADGNESTEESVPEEYGVETVTLTPAGKVIALVKRFFSTKDVYLSMYINDSTLGLRIENEESVNMNENIDTTESNVEPSSFKVMRGSFFCHTDDDVRYTVFKGPSVVPSLKPDKCGTVCISASFIGKISVTVCSNGNIKIFSSEEMHFEKKKDKVFDPLIYEQSRFIGKNGQIIRSLCSTLPDGSQSPYAKDLMSADGSRILFSNSKFNRKGLDILNIFHKKLLSDAPENWEYIEFSPDGSILFHIKNPISSSVSHPSLNNIVETTIDAEKKTEISVFQDGRMIIKYVDKKVEVIFSDGTVITTHSEGNVLNISKPNFPSIEMDVEVDNIGRSHSQGIEVPINKGGERVRSRIALPDGTAVFIKYDTKVTATTNGSIKLVRRDKTTILVKDNGDVTYTSRNLWNKKALDLFTADCKDGIVIPEANTISSNSTVDLTKNISTTNTLSKSSIPNTLKPTLNKKTKKSESIVKLTTVETLITTETLIIEEKEPQETKILMNIYNLTCFIQDYEFNRFEIDLKNNPLEPKITLSGEVDGVKAPAVSEAPMEPRLFIIHRNGDANEIVSFQDVESFEKISETCVDANKIISDVQTHPSDLAPAKMHKYSIQRRLLGGHQDSFTFEEVFGKRNWLTKEHTATRLYLTRFNNSVKYKRLDITHSPQRYFESVTLIEHMPLSQEGYKNLTRDIARCEEFRDMRVKSINRFAVDDPRQQHEIDAEENVMKKLKLAYKVAKSNAAKRKEMREKEKGLRLDEESLGKVSSIIVEGDEDEDEDQVEFPDDDDHVETDPEILEIQATFQDFAIEATSDAWSSSSNHLLPMEDLRDALIRLFNQFISPDIVERGLMECGGFDKSIKELTLSEFTGVYRSVQKMLNGTNEDLSLQVDDLADDDTIPPNNNNDTTWDSPSPKKTNNKLLPNLPLDLGPLEWDDTSEYKTTDNVNMNEKYPAGSAVNVARRSFAAFQNQQL